jgi:uncharacterized protein YjbJ (UPF0337 family)
MGSTTDKVSGGANQAAGKVKETAGKATGSTDLEAEGLAQQAKGKARRRAEFPGATLRDRDHFDAPETFEYLRDQITVGQIPIGLSEGISSDGTIQLAPGMVRLTGAAGDRQAYSLPAQEKDRRRSRRQIGRSQWRRAGRPDDRRRGLAYCVARFDLNAIAVV